MVINPNTQGAANANLLNSGAANQTKPAARSGSNATDLVPTTEEADAIISSRNAEDTSSAAIFSIADERGALDVMEYVRNHILTNPAASMSVQGNPRPETVLELLQGAFAE
jgi:hypothetical protein